MDKGAAEAFFDPAGIDSSSYGLNLFGHRQAADPNGGIPSVLPNLGITPKYYDPNSFTAPSKAGGQWNAMAQRLAGPMYKPTLMSGQPGSAPMMVRNPGGNSGPVHGQMAQPSIAALLARFGGMR